MDRSNKMLIDASHPEETRVVVLRGGRVEEFDYESAARKLLRGNIYLAKVTRVEPSLQAAFVEYGGNRHGFLAFNEIHPDYYQIPVADREALKQEEAAAEAEAEAEAEDRAQRRGRRGRQRSGRRAEAAQSGDSPETVSDPEAHAPADDAPFDALPAAALDHDAVQDGDRLEGPVMQDRKVVHEELLREYSQPADLPEPIGNGEDQGVIEVEGAGEGANGEAEPVEQVATEDDALEEVPERPRRRLRQYKIQEVIKRRQIILVQVVKEERGNKGAALTTYISLAGRYTVLMPNTGRGGGISRKITQPQDRKRLKAIAEELDVAEGMGLIIRTAGAARTKQEIKRDYEYLLRLWESVRDLTLSSTAPCLVYEEGNLIKRSIRDLYSKDIDDIFVSGEGAHREARDFMTMLMPGHGDNVQRYDGSEPLFTRFGIERQLNALFSPFVTLRSGGYIVINQTEALVSVDVNSGKATREFSIEETALNTNIEAAEEIARQLKLRDLAGLIVIDFIDMEEKRNNRNVERRLKDALRHDRARIQVGRISHFGLLEMSRQRLRTGVLEGSTSQCPHCQGTGIIRSTESVALAVLRGLEDNLLKQPSSLSAVTTSEVAIYILNHKRAFINEMERRHGISITIDASGRMHGANFAIERVASKATAPRREGRGAAVSMDWGFDGDEPADDDRREGEHRDDGDETREEAEGYEERRGRADRDEDREGGEEGRSTRRRRRRRGRRDREEGQGDDRPVNGDAPRSAARDAEDSGWSDRPEQAGPRDEVVADEEPVQARSGGAAAEAEDRGHREAGAREQGEDADRSRRGRRRGRRGGRGRGRDERPRAGGDAAGSSNGGEGGWGIAEIAKPGAEQPQGPEAALATRWDDGYSQAPRAAVAGNDAGRHERALVAGGVAGGDLDAAPAYEPVIERVPIIESPPQTEAPLEPERREARLPEPVGEPPARAAEPALVAETHTPAPAEPAEDPSRPARKGWWQRRFGGA